MNSNLQMTLIILMLAAVAVCAVIVTRKYLNSKESVQYITVPVQRVAVPMKEEQKQRVRIKGFAPMTA